MMSLGLACPQKRRGKVKAKAGWADRQRTQGLCVFTLKPPCWTGQIPPCEVCPAKLKPDAARSFGPAASGFLQIWWAVQDLNLWPPPCKGGAQPTELTAQILSSIYLPGLVGKFIGAGRQIFPVSDGALKELDVPARSEYPVSKTRTKPLCADLSESPYSLFLPFASLLHALRAALPWLRSTIRAASPAQVARQKFPNGQR